MPTYRDTVLADSPHAYWRLGDADGALVAAEEVSNRNGSYLDAERVAASSLLSSDADAAAQLASSQTSGPAPTGIAAPIDQASSELVLEVWVRHEDGQGAGGQIVHVYGADDYTVLELSLVIRWDGSTRELVISGLGDEFRVGVDSFPGPLDDGNPHHLVFQLSDSRISVYADARRVAYRSQALGLIGAVTVEEVTWGNGVSSFPSWPGEIDEAAIYGAALSDDQIAGHYEAAGYRLTFRVSLKGSASVYRSTASRLVGYASARFVSTGARLPGSSSVLNRYDVSIKGKASVYRSTRARLAGRYAVLVHVGASLRGKASVIRRVGARLVGTASVGGRFGARLVGLHSSEDASLDRYELYVGQDAEPDFSASPAATSASLPITHALAAPSSGTRRYVLVTRRRNRWGLVSQNQREDDSRTELIIAADGTATAAPPSAPEQIEADPAAGGGARLTALYEYGPDGDNAADQWRYYLTTDGTDPDPATDTPTDVEMLKVDGLAKLDTTTAQQSDGTTIKVLVRTRRTSDGVESTNTSSVQITADAQGPAATDQALIATGTDLTHTQ